jgi:hypothetical protein
LEATINIKIILLIKKVKDYLIILNQIELGHLT